MSDLEMQATQKIKSFLPALLGPVKTILIPFIPDPLLSKYQQGKMTLVQLKNNQQIFEKLLADINKTMLRRADELLTIADPFDAIVAQEQIELAAKYCRYIETLKQSLKYVANTAHQTDDASTQQDPLQQTAPCWFDMFKDITMRMNEPWRQDLLARCIALEDEQSNAVSLRTLWHIGLLDAQTFHSFALFLDSSIDLDGYPVIVLCRDDLVLNVESNDGSYSGNLIYLISGLIENGIIQNGEFELPSEEPINVVAQDCGGTITNLEQKAGRTTMIRLEGFNCTDLGLDLYRLYEPTYNQVSGYNFAALADMLADSEGVSFSTN